MEEGWDAQVYNTDMSHAAADAMDYEMDTNALSDDDALRFNSVTEVTKLLRSAYLDSMLRRLNDFKQLEGGKNAITQDDPEYQYVSDCSTLVLRIEAEKSRVMVFLRAHYSLCFPELAMFFTDSVLYAKVVKLIKTNMNLTDIVDELEELVPSQMLVVVMACASTTSGRELNAEELQRVLEACQEMENLEEAKQLFLEYIQISMPLICPNLCAYLDTGLTSQLFSITGSVAKLAIMDVNDLIKLGSRRGNDSGIAIKTTGFLSNCDFVANLQPQLRPKALRLVANSVLDLARIDANRRAASKDEGVRTRRLTRNRIVQWLDPPVVRGAGHNMYERRGRKRQRQTR